MKTRDLIFTVFFIAIFSNYYGQNIKEENNPEKDYQNTDTEPYFLFRTNEGESYLGGQPPKELIIPKFEFNAPFQYLGKLSASDESFKILPFDIHLIAPIYLNFDKVYVNYSSPLNPVVLEIEKLKNTGTSYDDLKPDSEIIYEKVYFEPSKTFKNGKYLGHTGIANWIQYPDIPTDPITGQDMIFLAQISNENGVKTKSKNFELENKDFERYFEELNFWIDGDLYIFYSPKSKIVCFLIQST